MHMASTTMNFLEFDYTGQYSPVNQSAYIWLEFTNVKDIVARIVFYFS